MDWKATFTAAGKDVLLGRAAIEGEPRGGRFGGYAGLSFRGSESFRQLHSLDSEGRKDRDSHGKNARWLDYHGVINDQGATAGVTIFDHPENLRHPTPWYIYFEGMQYFSPALLFNKAHTLSVGQKLTLRYRILVHPGRSDPEILERDYKDFAASR
jgi:hypothetical protein